jgi:hypothetical protein
MKMDNVDIDIYISQVVKFFEKNPNELFILIGNLDKGVFFERIKHKATENHINGEDVNLTRAQMIDIVVNMHKENDILEEKPKTIFLSTKYGEICLN